MSELKRVRTEAKQAPPKKTQEAEEQKSAAFQKEERILKTDAVISAVEARIANMLDMDITGIQAALYLLWYETRPPKLMEGHAWCQQKMLEMGPLPYAMAKHKEEFPTDPTNKAKKIALLIDQILTNVNDTAKCALGTPDIGRVSTSLQQLNALAGQLKQRFTVPTPKAVVEEKGKSFFAGLWRAKEPKPEPTQRQQSPTEREIKRAPKKIKADALTNAMRTLFDQNTSFSKDIDELLASSYKNTKDIDDLLGEHLAYAQSTVDDYEVVLPDEKETAEKLTTIKDSIERQKKSLSTLNDKLQNPSNDDQANPERWSAILIRSQDYFSQFDAQAIADRKAIDELEKAIQASKIKKQQKNDYEATWEHTYEIRQNLIHTLQQLASAVENGRPIDSKRTLANKESILSELFDQIALLEMFSADVASISKKKSALDTADYCSPLAETKCESKSSVSAPDLTTDNVANRVKKLITDSDFQKLNTLTFFGKSPVAFLQTLKAYTKEHAKRVQINASVKTLLDMTSATPLSKEDTEKEFKQLCTELDISQESTAKQASDKIISLMTAETSFGKPIILLRLLDTLKFPQPEKTSAEESPILLKQTNNITALFLRVDNAITYGTITPGWFQIFCHWVSSLCCGKAVNKGVDSANNQLLNPGFFPTAVPFVPENLTVSISPAKIEVAMGQTPEAKSVVNARGIGAGERQEDGYTPS